MVSKFLFLIWIHYFFKCFYGLITNHITNITLLIPSTNLLFFKSSLRRNPNLALIKTKQCKKIKDNTQLYHNEEEDDDESYHSEQEESYYHNEDGNEQGEDYDEEEDKDDDHYLDSQSLSVDDDNDDSSASMI